MKKMLQGACIAIGCTIFTLISGCQSSPLLEDNYYKDFSSTSPLEQKYSQRGHHNVSYAEYNSDNPSIKTISVWYPQDLDSNDKRYPMIMVVNASNTKASTYKPFFVRLASWGFIVVGTEVEQAGAGKTTSVALNFMLKNSALHDRIDTANIGVIGYSQGGAGAIRAVTEYSNSSTFKTIFTGSAAYATLAKNMGWEYNIAKVNIPYFMTAGTGSSDDTGVKDTSREFGGVAPLSSLVKNYDGISSNVFKVRARVVGAEHWQMMTLTDGYMTAWMLYQLQSDKDAASVFIGDKAELLTNKKWQDVKKNAPSR